ncbi:hypothetical protein RZS08_27850, partial [Arthrospira platensis SPKY1]|nr:hypothetical protein [Arthrospira platensis SPKY1]
QRRVEQQQAEADAGRQGGPVVQQVGRQAVARFRQEVGLEDLGIGTAAAQGAFRAARLRVDAVAAKQNVTERAAQPVTVVPAQDQRPGAVQGAVQAEDAQAVEFSQSGHPRASSSPARSRRRSAGTPRFPAPRR